MALDTLDGLDSLDDLLDTAPSAADGIESLDDLLDELETVSDPGGQSGEVPKIGVKAVEPLDFLDVLDLFPSVEGVAATLPAISTGRAGLDTLSDFSSTGDYNFLGTYYIIGKAGVCPVLLEVITANSRSIEE